jgi:RHS repeat-associated protein
MVAPAPSRPILMPLSPSRVPRPFQGWGTDNPHPFTGRPLYYLTANEGQAKVRLQDHRARWLDLLHGRWLQRDPAGYVDGMNLYEYAASRPTSASDVLGLNWVQDEKHTHIYSPDETGGSLKQLVTRVMSDHPTENLNPDLDWACIWPVECPEGVSERLVGTTLKHRYGKDWVFTRDSCLKFDVSNLLPPDAPGAEIRGTIAQDKGALGGGFNLPLKTANGVIEEIMLHSQEGRTPMSSLVLMGHSSGDEVELRELGRSRGGMRGPKFSVQRMRELATVGGPSRQTYANAIKRIGPPRCWFAVNAKIRLFGCETKHHATTWAPQILRGNQDYGVTVKALDLGRLNGQPAVRYYDRHEDKPLSQWYFSLEELEGNKKYFKTVP